MSLCTLLLKNWFSFMKLRHLGLAECANKHQSFLCFLSTPFGMVVDPPWLRLWICIQLQNLTHWWTGLQPQACRQCLSISSCPVAVSSGCITELLTCAESHWLVDLIFLFNRMSLLTLLILGEKG